MGEYSEFGNSQECARSFKATARIELKFSIALIWRGGKVMRSPTSSHQMRSPSVRAKHSGY
ncbi:hypothetical protein [Coleofasciculus sp. FACHB-129]|uniref:hypothetical protein n=1 Tax=Cyanophyceae TaxID=3028117 RepID=UPI00168958D7|nr:hypothetical protein [Coleofasciculus sp. FACHB-129]MBD1894283.1 hypothetical protein [Coleofasciculus sp. FACHB-129]